MTAAVAHDPRRAASKAPVTRVASSELVAKVRSLRAAGESLRSELTQQARVQTAALQKELDKLARTVQRMHEELARPVAANEEFPEAAKTARSMIAKGELLESAVFTTRMGWTKQALSKALAARRVLNPPPRDLRRQDLPTRTIRADQLFRISRRTSGEPYFGRRATNRFDDSHKQLGKRYGTCYCGFDLETALAETVLHDEEPRAGRFRLAATEFITRHLVRFHSRADLVLADLTGAALKRLGGTAAICGIVPYDLPQQWSRAIHRHPQQVNGICYMSRHLNDRAAVVVFDRAARKLGSPTYSNLAAVPGIDDARKSLGIVIAVP